MLKVQEQACQKNLIKMLLQLATLSLVSRSHSPLARTCANCCIRGGGGVRSPPHLCMSASASPRKMLTSAEEEEEEEGTERNIFIHIENSHA